MASAAHLELLARRVYARRVYELHGCTGWDRLPEVQRLELIAAYWRARSAYRVVEPRETRIDG